MVEKAYLKVRGGYDFSGSNSGTDLWMLAGWIPEQIFLQSSEPISYRLWQRIYEPYQSRDLLITLGTGRLSAEEEAAYGLTSKHDYAVQELKDESGCQSLLVKNPWSGSNEISRVSPLCQPTCDDHCDIEKRGSGASALATGNPGRFWTTMCNVMQLFESVYLNWNPELFPHRRDVHFSWQIESCPKRSFRTNPQYSLQSEGDGGTVWLLLQRHFRSHSQETGSDDQNPSSDDPPGAQELQSDFMGLYVFASDGKRVFSSDGAMRQGPYVDSPQTLLQLDMPSSTTYTVVASQERLEVSTAYSFTLTAFSSCPVRLHPAGARYPHWTSHEAAWAGGSLGLDGPGFGTYFEDPQFGIVVEPQQRTDLVVCLETPHENIPIRVALVFSGDTADNAKGSSGLAPAISSAASRAIVAHSGDYRRGGCVLVELDGLSEGRYTIVCSTFEVMRQQRRCPFTLHVGSSSGRCQLRRIPSETAGRLSTRLPAAKFPPRSSTIAAPLWCSRLTKLRVFARSRPPRLVHLDSAGGRARLFPEQSSASSLSSSSSPNQFYGRPLHVSRPHPSSFRLSLQLNPPSSAFPCTQVDPLDVLAVSNEGRFSDALGPASVSATGSNSSVLRTPDVDIIPETHHHHRRQEQDATASKGPLPIWIVLERLGPAPSLAPLSAAAAARQPEEVQNQQQQQHTQSSTEKEEVVDVEVLSDQVVEGGMFQPH
ncbi:MAG: cysteine protease [Lichina confinis]|nr:MAG: cysteine protease [Lichina confinis]